MLTFSSKRLENRKKSDIEPVSSPLLSAMLLCDVFLTNSANALLIARNAIAATSHFLLLSNVGSQGFGMEPSSREN